MRTIMLILAAVGIGGGVYWYTTKNKATSTPSAGSSGGFLEVVGNLMTGTTRGIRNNNPGNLKWSSVNNWVGQTGKDAAGFAIFDKPENGIRALNKTLNTYNSIGVNTARKIVERYTAGDASNIQSNYMLKIEQLTGKNRDTVLGAADRLNLIKAIMMFENANYYPYSDAMIQAAMAL